MTDLTAPRLGGVVPFLVDWGDTPHPARALQPAGTLASLRIEHPEPEQVQRVVDGMGVAVRVEAGPAPRLEARLRSPRGDATIA